MILYPLSSDPFHRGHYNISKKAQARFGKPVTFMVSQNPLKTEGLLSLNERVCDLIITIFSYEVLDKNIKKENTQSKLDQIKQNILIAPNNKIISHYMDEADTIIRGVRSKEDEEYSINLLKKIGKKEWIHKAELIIQDDSFKKTSSTHYKKAYAILHQEIQAFPSVYGFLNRDSINEKCVNLELSNQSCEIILKHKKEILSYLLMIEELESNGRYEGLDFKYNS